MSPRRVTRSTPVTAIMVRTSVHSSFSRLSTDGVTASTPYVTGVATMTTRCSASVTGTSCFSQRGASDRRTFLGDASKMIRRPSLS